MGKGFIIDKIMSGLVGIFSAVVMFFAIMFAMVRETMWPFLVVAALTCPLWHWLLRKFILKERLVLLWLIRGGAVLAGCVLLSFANRYFPFYTCMDVMIEDRMKTQYEETIKTDHTELVDVTGIQKELVADYYKVKASVNYKDVQSGEEKSEEITLYFDRYNGQYFANFDNMRKYRQHYWNYEEGKDLCMFEQEQVNGVSTRFREALLADDYDSAGKLMSDSLKKTVTEEKWDEWQDMFATRGEYVPQDSPATLSLDYVTEGGKRTEQLLHISWKIVFTGGEVTVNTVMGEDLKFREAEIAG